MRVIILLCCSMLLCTMQSCKTTKKTDQQIDSSTGVIHISLIQKAKPEKFIYKYQDYKLTKLKFTSRAENNWTFSYELGKMNPSDFLALIKADKRVLDAYFIQSNIK